MPQMYGIAHIAYLIIALSIVAICLILAKKYLKTEKSQKIFIKIIALLLFINILINRISLSFVDGIWYLIPNTFCGMTSLLFSLFVLFGKKNMKCYDCLWYMAMCGGIVTLAYPDFIADGPTIFYPSTFTSFTHHTFMVFLAIALVMFDWYKPSLNGVYRLPIGIFYYIWIGFFEVYVLKDKSGMCVNDSLIEGTPLNCWFVLGVGTLLAIIFNLIVDSFKKEKAVTE